MAPERISADLDAVVQQDFAGPIGAGGRSQHRRNIRLVMHKLLNRLDRLPDNLGMLGLGTKGIAGIC